jgi:excisionase family DNA binding protein
MSGALVDEHEAARLLAISVKTLRRWRWAKREVPFVKIGRSVRYETPDLERYIAERKMAQRSV